MKGLSVAQTAANHRGDPDWAVHGFILARFSICRIGNITKNSAVQRSHGICMLRSAYQYDRGAPISDLICFKSNQTRHGHVVDPCSLPKIEFQRNSLNTYELRAPLLDLRARTLVSRYSSR